MYTPHTVTLYNVSIETAADYSDTVVSNITVLEGVFVDATKAVNVRETGDMGADAVNLYIPFSVKARDGTTGAKKTYVGPMEYWRAADKSKLWTLTDNGNTFFIKGRVVEPGKELEYLDMRYDDVYVVTKVDRMDFGSPEMQHFEVGAR